MIKKNKKKNEDHLPVQPLLHRWHLRRLFQVSQVLLNLWGKYYKEEDDSGHDANDGVSTNIEN